MKLQITKPKIRKFLPFTIIFLAAVVLLATLKSPAPPLFAPQMKLIPLDVRGPAERNFALPDLSGKSVHLSDFKGKVVLLNFFATWCPPCRDEMPSLEGLFQATKDKGFLVLGIASDPEGEKVIAPFAKKYGLTFPLLLDTKKEVFNLYFVGKIPVTYLIDKQGRIAGMYPGAADWNSDKAQALIDQLLQES